VINALGCEVIPNQAQQSELLVLGYTLFRWQDLCEASIGQSYSLYRGWRYISTVGCIKINRRLQSCGKCLQFNMCLSSLTDVNCSLVVTPSNVVVVSGSSFRLNCRTNLTTTPVQWSNDGRLVTILGIITSNYSSKFTFDSSSLYDLVATKSDVSYCGSYTCVDDNGGSSGITPQSATAAVTIYSMLSFDSYCIVQR
jgi:hypothetical protein